MSIGIHPGITRSPSPAASSRKAQPAGSSSSSRGVGKKDSLSVRPSKYSSSSSALPASGTDPTAAKPSSLSREQVKELCQRAARKLVVLNNVVYDIEHFADAHPGGASILLKHAGEDISLLMRGKKAILPTAAAPAAAQEGPRNGIRTATALSPAQQQVQSQPIIVASSTLHRHSPSAYRMLECYRLCPLAGEDFDELQTSVSADDAELAQLESQMDYSRGILSQVHKLGPGYAKWVHSPISLSLRMFDSDFLELFSRTPWFVVPLVWLPVVALMCWLAMTGSVFSFPHWPPASPSNTTGPVNASVLLDESLAGALLPPSLVLLGAPLWSVLGLESCDTVSPLSCAALFLVGVAMWTLMEYSLHRFVFHAIPSSSPFAITFHYLMHGIHHKSPMDKDRLVFPPVPAAVLALLFYGLFALALPLGAARAVFAGTLFGYVAYDLTHYYLHHGSPGTGAVKSMKSYHMAHHYMDQDSGFGISSKTWDYWFGTLLDKNTYE